MSKHGPSIAPSASNEGDDTAPEDRLDRIGSDGWRSTVEIRQLRALLAVVEHGSVTAAALALGLAQSTVSEALSALDRATGTSALRRRRGTQATTLTDAGVAILPHARRMLQEIDALHHAVAGVTRGANAVVQVVANESISTYLLAAALGALRKEWPNVRFSVTIATCHDVRSAVAAGQCDLGLLLEDGSLRFDSSDLDSLTQRTTASTTVLCPRVPLVIFGGVNQPLVRRGSAVMRSALAPFPFFVADSHDVVQQYFATDALPGPQLQAVGSIEGVKRAVEADPTALGLLPAYAIAESLDTGRARALALLPPPPDVQVVGLLPASPAGAHAAVADLFEQMRRSRLPATATGVAARGR